MKIVLEDIFAIVFVDTFIVNIDIVLTKLKNKDLSDDDFDMIISHLEYYKCLLKEAEINGKDN